MKKVKKITMLVTGATIMLNTAILAVTGIVNAPSGLVLRGEPAKTGEPITTIEDKAKVEIIEKSGEWYKVTYNGQEGYLFAEYVNEEQTTPPTTPVEGNTNENPEGNSGENGQTNPPVTQPSNPQVNLVGTTVQLKNNAKIYMMPLMSSTPIGSFNAGISVNVEKEVTNWVYVTDGTQAGWIRTYLINGEILPQESNPPTETPAEQPSAPVEQPPVAEQPPVENPATTAKGKINVDYANVRKEESQTSEIVTTLANGTEVKINAETAEWYKITYTGIDGTVYDGYIAKRLVTVE